MCLVDSHILPFKGWVEDGVETVLLITGCPQTGRSDAGVRVQPYDGEGESCNVRLRGLACIAQSDPRLKPGVGRSRCGRRG